MAILELQNLKKYYATHKAVDDISFSIPEGSIFGLLGPNGAGKTTLLRMITGIFYPDSGNIIFEGKRMDPVKDIPKIGYMPEERGLYKKMKIGEQALYLAMLKGLSRKDAMKKIKEWFVKFEMESWWNKKVSDLSKGMSQKLQFVTTVLHEPKLLILDEPFSGLDPVNSNLIKDEIFKLAQKGTTIIFSTHRMEQVEEICQKIVLVNNGKKILDGSVSQVKDDFKEYLFKIGFDSVPETINSNAFDIVDTKENFFTVKIKDGNKPSDVLQEFLNHKAGIISFNEILPSLNEIFIKVAGKINKLIKKNHQPTIMNKIWLVIKREYLTRVRNRTFILSTILLPLVFIGFIFASAYLSASSTENVKVAVSDSNGIFKNSFQSGKLITYEYPSDVNADNFKEKGYSAFLKIPKEYNSANDSISLISTKQIGMDAEDKIQDQINDAIRNQAFLKNNIDKKILDSINQLDENNMYHFRTIVKQGNKTEKSNSALSYGIGYGSGFLIYITLFIYGAAVMRGVMEEKMNRIAEVIISSVKPFQLMAGKILGIAAVGITQLLIWIVLIILLSTVTTSFFSPETLQHAQAMNSTMGAAGESSAAMNFLNAKSTFLSANWGLIIPCFLFYFVGGYLFYASLFAAVGSVVNEDPQEAQSLMLPITMPIILSFIIMTTAVGKPDAPISVWGSIIPFSSPIVMMGRIPSGNVPTWQIIVSMLSLIAGFILTTMLAAKIYRTGILLYGKKVTLKEMGKWLFRKS